MEDNMAAGAFGRATNYAWDGSLKFSWVFALGTKVSEGNFIPQATQVS